MTVFATTGATGDIHGEGSAAVLSLPVHRGCSYTLAASVSGRVYVATTKIMQ